MPHRKIKPTGFVIVDIKSYYKSLAKFLGNNPVFGKPTHKVTIQATIELDCVHSDFDGVSQEFSGHITKFKVIK